MENKNRNSRAPFTVCGRKAGLWGLSVFALQEVQKLNREVYPLLGVLALDCVLQNLPGLTRDLFSCL